MIRNDVLGWFLLGFGLEIPNNDLGRPTTLTPLWLAAKEKCGDCSMDEVLDALYNLGRDDAELYKLVPLGGGFQPVSFERKRNTAHWKEFFCRGSFYIKVLPGGRLRFQRLFAQLQAELPPVRPRVGFTA